MAPKAQIGFHAAYVYREGQAAETGVGNALVGAYLNKIGLPDRAIVYITQSPPEEMTWLSISDAQQKGIDVTIFAPSSDLNVTTESKPPSIRPPSPAHSTPAVASPAVPRLVLPRAVDPKYASETDGKARMHTCVDQYNANKTTDSNGGLKWIEAGGGYYSACNQRLKGN
jgi:hypothetical protein